MVGTSTNLLVCINTHLLQYSCQTYSIKLRREASYNSIKAAAQSVCEEVSLWIYVLIKVTLELKVVSLLAETCFHATHVCN